jgi:dUTP pyrophosphatase
MAAPIIKIKPSAIQQLDAIGTVDLPVRSSEYVLIEPGLVVPVSTGLYTEFSPGYYLQLTDAANSLLSGLVITGGVIDSDYRGEVKVMLRNVSNSTVLIMAGSIICSAVLTRCLMGKAAVFDPNTAMEEHVQWERCTPDTPTVWLTPNGNELPARKTPGSAGYDLASSETVTVGPGETADIDTGLFLHAVARGYVVMLTLRSSVAKTGVVLVGKKIVDRGEITLTVKNEGKEPFVVQAGDRVGQMILLPVASRREVTYNSKYDSPLHEHHTATLNKPLPRLEPGSFLLPVGMKPNVYVRKTVDARFNGFPTYMPLINMGTESVLYKAGDVVLKALVVTGVGWPVVFVSEDMSETARGAGGFGSSGVN